MSLDPQLKGLVRALQPIVSRVRTDVSAVKLTDGSRWTNEPITTGALERHLNGGPARGVCPIKAGTSVTCVGMLDLDSHGGETPWPEMAATAQRVMNVLTTAGYAPFAFRSSGGRGIHVYVMWDDPQDAYSVRQMLAQALGQAGFEPGAKGVAKGQIEVFPKQDAVGATEYGNQFILPLAGKSEPLEPLLGLEPMGKAYALTMDWPISKPVPVLAKPTRESGASGMPPEPISRVRDALFAIPNRGEQAPDYEEWFKLACAVHEATAGSDEGLEVFAAWSAQNDRHDGEFLKDRVWHYIKPGRDNARTRDTLFWRAQQEGWNGATVATADGFEDEAEEPEPDVLDGPGSELAVVDDHAETLAKRFEAKERWKKAINEALDERTLSNVVCDQIAADSVLSSIERGMLAEVLKTKLALFNSKTTIGDCRKMLAPKKEDKKKTGAWSDRWVYITDEDAFYLLDSDEVLTMQSFNAKFNRYLPRAEDNEFRRNASWVALEEMQIPTVTRRVYLPYADDLFELDGIKCANRFRRSSVPATATAYTPEGKKAIGIVQQHIRLLCDGRDDVIANLTSWLAYQVQQPGMKVRWAPLIKGIEGDGKSVLGDLLRSVLGNANVRAISPTVLGTNFTDWAHGVSVGVLEEIKLHGHNRYDILNAIKPYITNTHVEIHPKGGKVFNVLNVMNYMALTNHADALPLSDTDRRWLIIFSPFLSISQLEAVVGDTGAYFNALFAAIEDHREELRKWLMEYTLAETFRPNNKAPLTAEKSEMVSLNTPPIEEAVQEALQNGGVGIARDAVVIGKLKAAINSSPDTDVVVSDKELTRILAKMGWSKVPNQVKWDGSAVRVWTYGLPRCDQADLNPVIRRKLDKTKSVTNTVRDDYDVLGGL